MKLEIKHLAPYLPYGLKMVFMPNLPPCKLKGGNIYRAIEHQYKPFLVPLSELENYMDEYNQVFYPKAQMAKLPSHAVKVRIEVLSDYDIRSHAELDWLLYNHFDVFGLIEVGLALNRLNKT